MAAGSAQEREDVRVRGDRAARQRYHAAALAAKAEQMQSRRALADSYLRAHPPAGLISRATGLGVIDVRACASWPRVIAECEALIAASAGKAMPSKGSLEFLADAKTFGQDSAAVALANEPVLLSEVAAYFQCWPVLFNIGLNRAATEELIPSSSHAFHIDPEDVTQLKVFVPITDVDADRAFYALPAPLSDRVVAELNHTMGRVPDDVVARIAGESAQCFAGPAGVAAVCDTNRCFHYGGRPGRCVRVVLGLTYSLPTSTWFPRWNGDGEARLLMQGLTARADDSHWNALIGAELL